MIHCPIFWPSEKKDDNFLTFLKFIILFGFGYESPSNFVDPLKKRSIIFIMVMIIVQLFWPSQKKDDQFYRHTKSFSLLVQFFDTPKKDDHFVTYGPFFPLSKKERSFFIMLWGYESPSNFFNPLIKRDDHYHLTYIYNFYWVISHLPIF